MFVCLQTEKTEWETVCFSCTNKILFMNKFNKIALQIKKSTKTFVDKKNSELNSITPDGKRVYIDTSEFTMGEMCGKHVVYYIQMNGYIYVGQTNCISRRIQEHFSRKDSSVHSYIGELNDIYVKPLEIFDNGVSSRLFEKKLNQAIQYMFPKNRIINKIC